MPDNRRGRARRPRRARFQRFVNTVSRSWLIESLVRSLIIMLVVFGMLLTGYGLLAEVGAFSTDLTKLVQFAGSGDAVVSSTLDLFRGQVLAMLGLAKPVLTEEEVSMLPQTGALYATATPFAPARKLALGKAAAGGTPDPAGAEAGFLPYQVEATALQQEAPPLPSPGAGDTAADAAAGAADAGAPTATPAPPAVPGWIVIPRIGLDAPIVVSHTKWVVIGGETFAQWEAPNVYAAGWQEQSALLGEPGNTVLNGHHNVYGSVFGRLHELEQYDQIILYSGEREFLYLVSQVMKVEERDATLAQRQENARWIMHSSDERLTLVTCWPPTSNTYRLIVVAVPVK